jgi:flagellar basal body-associated protein FliL
MTNVSIAIKLAVALLLVAAIVATRFSSNKVREHERQKATSTRG